MNEPDSPGNVQSYLLDPVKSGWIGTGRYGAEFERRFADFIGTQYALSTISGTASLQLATASLGLEPGDEVIVPALTIVSTAFSVCYVGATPVLVDAEGTTSNLDPEQIESKITTRTRAIMPVLLYGHPVETDPILRLAGG